MTNGGDQQGSGEDSMKEFFSKFHGKGGHGWAKGEDWQKK